MLGRSVIGFLLLVVVVCGRGWWEPTPRATYDGFKVLRVSVKSSQYGDKAIHHMEEEELLQILSSDLDGIVDVLVSPTHLRSVTVTLDHYLEGQYKVQNEDVGATIKKQEADLKELKLGEDQDFHNSYHSYEEICARLDSLVETYPDKAEIIILAGKTYEGRDIKMIRLTSDIKTADSNLKPMIWLDGGIHAREWISPATMMFIIDALLGEEEPGSKDQVDAVLAKYQLVLAPVINPDGYEYSRDHVRLWRKTRKPSGCRFDKKMWYGGCLFRYCFGSDPNRNWNTNFEKKLGVSDDQCFDTYPGVEPWDQDNVKSVKTYLETNKQKLVVYVSYHSYSQLFLRPVCYSTDPPQHQAHHKMVGEAVVKAIKERHGMEFKNIQASELYMVSGSSVDWTYEELDVVDSYGFELRPSMTDPQEYGFILPPDQIRPSGEENVDGLLALIDKIYKQ